MSHVAFPIVWAIGLLVFAGIIAGRTRLLLAARPAARLDRIPERIRRTAVYGLGQRKFLSGEQPAGIMHALVFWGFVVLMIQVVLAVRPDVRRELGHPRVRARPAARPAVLHRPRRARGDRDRRRRLHALPAADRPHPAPVRHRAAPSSATTTPRTGRAS